MSVYRTYPDPIHPPDPIEPLAIELDDASFGILAKLKDCNFTHGSAVEVVDAGRKAMLDMVEQFLRCVESEYAIRAARQREGSAVMIKLMPLQVIADLFEADDRLEITATDIANVNSYTTKFKEFIRRSPDRDGWRVRPKREFVSWPDLVRPKYRLKSWEDVFHD